MNRDMDVIYILTPEQWIVDCLMADFERRRYRGVYLVWTSRMLFHRIPPLFANCCAVPHPQLRERIDRSNMAQQQIRTFKVLDVDYYPRESHVATFRDPWSFPVLFHPACNNLVRKHMESLAQKVSSTFCFAMLPRYPNQSSRLSLYVSL